MGYVNIVILHLNLFTNQHDHECTFYAWQIIRKSNFLRFDFLKVVVQSMYIELSSENHLVGFEIVVVRIFISKVQWKILAIVVSITSVFF